MSSSDGFCSTLTFTPGELGQVYAGPVPTAHHPNVTGNSSSTRMSPSPAASSVHAPLLAKQSSGSSMRASSPAPTVRQSSPTRSNSISSVATQSSSHAQTPPPNTIMSNPTPTFGSVPGLAAASSSSVGGVPLTTPPQTPMSSTMSSTSSVSGASVLGKRDSGAASESEKEERDTIKKRRIAPTLVSTEGQTGAK